MAGFIGIGTGGLGGNMNSGAALGFDSAAMQHREDAERVREAQFTRQQALQLAISAGHGQDPMAIVDAAHIFHNFIAGMRTIE